jgi:hypothetical protein
MPASKNGNAATQEREAIGRRINFKDVPMGFEAVPAGRYRAVFGGGEWKEGKQAEYFRAEFTITGDSEEWDGRKVSTNWSLSEKSRPIIKQQLNILGIPENELESEEFDMDDAIAQLQGAACCIEVAINKEGYSNIKNILPEDEAIPAV